MFISTENQWLFIIHTFIQIEVTLSDEMTNKSVFKVDDFYESSVEKIYWSDIFYNLPVIVLINWLIALLYTWTT